MHYALIKDGFLYAGEEELTDRLRALLQVSQIAGCTESLRDVVSRYDWEFMTAVYDDFFEGLAQGRSRTTDAGSDGEV